MNNYIPLSLLNDYIFCPYSIYLHNVYMESDEDIYHATPQLKGRISHQSVDKQTYSTSRNHLASLHVYSEELGIFGVIDLLKTDRKLLIERKYQLKNIYRGQFYQLWAQYFCLLEMGYDVEQLAFYETSTNKTIPVALPGKQEKQELINFIESFRTYNPEAPIATNRNKCIHCIYCNLCDKTTDDNVYT